MSWTNHFQEQLVAVKRSPAPFAIVVLVGSIVGSGALYWFFNWEMWNVLEMKDRRIAELSEAIQTHSKAKPTPSSIRRSATWGFTPDQCEVRAPSAPFLQFKEEYKMVAVCGVGNPSIDKYEDRNISLSEAFTITNNEISISFPMNEQTRQAQRGNMNEAPTPLTPSPPIGQQYQMLMKISVWGELILIPKSVAVSDIKKLADVRAYKGKILSEDDC